MGGEWASGAALVAETWPARHRGKALALVQSSWAVGYALGAALVAIVMPRFGWRAVFFAGIIPALIALWVQRSLHEPEAWRKARPQRLPAETVVPWANGQEHSRLRDYECRNPLCMVGAVHLGSALSVDARCRGGTGPGHRDDVGSGPSSCRPAHSWDT
jgi:MFS family permease